MCNSSSVPEEDHSGRRPMYSPKSSPEEPPPQQSAPKFGARGTSTEGTTAHCCTSYRKNVCASCEVGCSETKFPLNSITLMKVVKFVEFIKFRRVLFFVRLISASWILRCVLCVHSSSLMADGANSARRDISNRFFFGVMTPFTHARRAA